MNTQIVTLEVNKDGVAVVFLANPPVNAHSQLLLSEMAWTFDTISDREDIKVAILTGAGKCFCAGADIKERMATDPQPGDHWQNSRRCYPKKN